MKLMRILRDLIVAAVLVVILAISALDEWIIPVPPSPRAVTSRPSPSPIPTPAPQRSPETIHGIGVLSIPASYAVNVDKTRDIQLCTMGPEYDDIYEGTQVVITDQAGEVVSLSELDPGILLYRDDEPLSDLVCEFTFTFEVPAGRPAYGMEIARRGKLFFTGKELRSKMPSITLGIP